MNVTVTPHPLRGTVQSVVSSKSHAHRLLICAALADRPTILQGVDPSADLLATVRCLRALGADIAWEGAGLSVTPLSSPCKNALLDCGESGSTLRFLLPVAAALGADCAFTGQGKLKDRPLSPLREAMEDHGCVLSAPGQFPLTCSGALKPGAYTLAGNVSSQFFTGLLLALPQLPGDSRLLVDGPLESRPYVDMTLETLALFGIRVDPLENGYFIPGGQRFRSPGTAAAEGDWSGAAFFLAAGALPGAAVTCAPLRPDSRQGDRAVAPLLAALGARVTDKENAVSVQPGPLRGIVIDLSDIPDLAPILAAAAAFARGETVLRPIARLRLKESDRVAAILALLHSLGVEARAAEDQLIIRGRGGVSGGTVDGFHDHRIVMAAAIAATAADGPVTILGAEAADKSYPGFFSQFRALGGLAKED